MAKNDDFRVSIDYFEHPKTECLSSACGEIAILCHLRLIAWAAKFRPDSGSLAGYADAQIEVFAKWRGEPGGFIKALVDNHLLDGIDRARQLHDWSEAQGWLIGTSDRKYYAQLGVYTKKLGSKAKAEEFLEKKRRTRGKTPRATPGATGSATPFLTCSSPAPILTSSLPAPTAQEQLLLPAASKKPEAHRNGNEHKVAKLEPKPSVLAWNAYRAAYHDRYGVDPVRNAKTNALLAQLVARVGALDAAPVAAYFVKHPLAFYVQRGHAVDLLLRDCEKLRTEWITKRQVTATQAQQDDRTATTGNAAKELIEEIRDGRFRA